MAATTRRTPPTKTASISDVARLAGVSAQTVSRVSRGATAVSPSTKERVLLAMSELGYTPNRAARALRNGAYGSLGIIAQQLERTGDALTTTAVVAAAQELGYSATLVEVRNQDAEEISQATQRLSHSAIDGLVIIGIDNKGLDALTLPANLPVVVADSRLMGRYPSVVANQIRGMQDAVNHLLDLGHRRVDHVAGAEDSPPTAVRLATWRRCLTERGLVAPEPHHGDWSAESGYRIGLLLAADPEVTAVSCANDEMAIGVLRAMHEAGRSVPGDVSVVGFDGIALSGYTYPPLTTVRQDFSRLGHELVNQLVSQIKGTSGNRAHHLVIPTELTVRGSTAAPRR